MKDIKEFSFLLIPYLVICSGIYHIAYWDTFDINGLAYIGFSDLIKSFVYPFLTFGTLFFVSIVSTEVMFRIDDWFPSKSSNTTTSQGGFMPSGGGRNTPIGKTLNSKPGLFILVVLWAVVVVLLYKHGQTIRWLIWGTVISLVPYLFLDRVGFLNSIFSNNSIRQFVIRILIYIPAFSFAAGKYESELIYRNIKYKYIIKATPVPMSNSFTIDTIKLIGISDKYFFTTDLTNSNILLMRSDNFDTLRLHQH